MSKKAAKDRKETRATAGLEGVPDLFYAFAEQFPGGVFIKDANSRVLYMNPYATSIFGAESWLKRSPDQFLEKAYAEPLLEGDRTALEEGLADSEVCVPDKDGVPLLWRSIRFPIERPGKDPLIGVLALDITGKLSIQKKLEDEKSRYRAVVENFPNGFICLFDRENRFMLMRGKGLEMIGRKPEEFEGKTIYEIFQPEALKVIEQHHEAALAGKTSEFEIEIDGNHYETLVLPVADSNGVVSAGMCMVQLVTDRYRVRNILHRREQEYKALVENARDIIARFDSSYRLLYINTAFERITTLPLAWFRNMKLDELHLPSKSLQDFIKTLGEVFETGEQTSIEIAYSPKSGAKYFQVRLTPEFDPEGNVETILAVGRDITGYKRLEQDLRRAKDQAEAASRAKSEFLANMSHEIRTPMNAMLGYMDLITGESLDPGEREYLRIVKDSAETLLTIINDILDYSKIEAGKIELEAQSFNPISVIESVIKEHAVLADQKDLELGFICEENLPPYLLGDISRLKQILRNLISNALKFTEEGSVTVRVARDVSPTPSGKTGLRFSVIDTGIGLSPELKDKLFESFTQLESGMRRKYKGTGLGLAICKKLTGLLGGNIWVESDPGRGSAFSFTAVFDEISPEPGRVVEEMERQAEQDGGLLPSLKILLAEDNEINRTFLTELLLENGHTVGVAENGEEVLEKLAAGAYDVVLMDVQMPVMDGMEATRKIREGRIKGVNSDIPVIGLSAYAMSEHRNRFIKAGMNDFVSKPVNFDVLFKTISKVLQNPERPAPQPEPEPREQPAARRRDDELLDVEGITEHYRNKGKMFARLCSLFFESVRDNMVRLKAAAAEKNFERIEKLSHSIRGSGASMGAQALADAAADLEEAATGRDIEAANRKIERLEALLDPTLQEMARIRDDLRN